MIERTEVIDKSEWESFYKTCSGFTFFHSHEWAQIWNNSRGLIPYPLMICLSSGKKVLVPMSYQQYTPFKRFYYGSAQGTYGQWLCEDGITDVEEREILGFLKTKLPKGIGLQMRANPFLEKATTTEFSVSDTTHVIDLSESLEAIENKFSKGHFSAITKSRRDGVIIRKAETEQDWKDYYKIYQNTVKRWGNDARNHYPEKVFNAVRSLNSKAVTLYLACLNGKTIAGALCFESKNHIVYWHGASLEVYFQHKPAHLLISEIIKESIGKGIRWFDFNPSGGLEGVRKFKSGFGAKELQCPVWNYSTKNILLWKAANRVYSTFSL